MKYEVATCLFLPDGLRVGPGHCAVAGAGGCGPRRPRQTRGVVVLRPHSSRPARPAPRGARFLPPTRLLARVAGQQHALARVDLLPRLLTLLQGLDRDPRRIEAERRVVPVVRQVLATLLRDTERGRVKSRATEGTPYPGMAP